MSSVTYTDSSSNSPSATPSSRASGAGPNQLVQGLVERVLERLGQQTHLGSTYRLQFQGAELRFADAAQLSEYFKELGVSHIYASPLLKAKSGSTHGYDVVDPTQLNPELGTPEEYGQLVDRLNAEGIGQLLDIVPNHMSVANDENRWWMDVLRHGPASRYARFFDIDWEPVKNELHGRVLLPVLDGVSGQVLEAGRLPVHYQEGEFLVAVNDSLLPLDPKTCVDILTPGLDTPDFESAPQPAEDHLADTDVLELRSIIAALKHLPDRNRTSEAEIAERFRESTVIQRRLHRLTQQSARVAQHIERNLHELNGVVGDPRSFDQLDALLENQAYRLVHWKASSDEINYRRFFDVTTLAALSLENVQVFEATHRLPLQLAATGRVNAFRIDHVDGLFDPNQYLWRLQWGYLREVGRFEHEAMRGESGQEWQDIEAEYLEALYPHIGGPEPRLLFQDGGLQRPRPAEASEEKASQSDSAQQPERIKRMAVPVYVEKILGPEEPLPSAWPIVGTTGYEFLNTLNGLFIEPQGMNELKRIYQRFMHDTQNFEDIVYQCKRLILRGPMQSEVQLLAHRLDRLAHRFRHSRDFTLNALQFVLSEIIACFSVYRTYIREGSVSKRDEQVVQRAVAQARRRNPAAETATFDFVRQVLLLAEPPELDDDSWQEREFLVGRFQQVTSPVQAKGVEDTAFYRYIPLLSLDEVGGEPTSAVKSVGEFHQQNLQRHEQWPSNMLTTTTHDTKRSEDVRARINVLTEIPAAWRNIAQRWHRLNSKYLRDVDGEPAPSRNDEWLLYQTLIGMWPATPPSHEERQSLIARLQQYMEKATHEAKLRTSWISPSQQYDSAVQEFVATILKDPSSKFSLSLQQFVDAIINAGLINAASQVLLKLTSPGMPDIYQGQELWDFSLVDPDNRRPVDYELRRHLLGELRYETSEPGRRIAFMRNLGSNPRDNRLKLAVTRAGLQFRQLLNLSEGKLRYVPLEVRGEHGDHVCAFAWHGEQAGKESPAGIVIVPRLVQRLSNRARGGGKTASLESAATPTGPELWGDTRVILSVTTDQPLINQFTGQSVDGSRDEILVAELLADFPLGLFAVH